jgi:hypothetical protein
LLLAPPALDPSWAALSLLAFPAKESLFDVLPALSEFLLSVSVLDADLLLSSLLET